MDANSTARVGAAVEGPRIQEHFRRPDALRIRVAGDLRFGRGLGRLQRFTGAGGLWGQIETISEKHGTLDIGALRALSDLQSRAQITILSGLTARPMGFRGHSPTT